MKVFILSNDDPTSHTIFAPLLESADVEVVGIAFTTSVATKSEHQFRGAIQLLRKMSWTYWLYLVWINGWFRIYDLLVDRLKLAPRRGTFVSLRRLARLRGVPIQRVANFNAPSFHRTLRDSGVELLVIRVDQILKPATLGIPRHGTWCVHSSLLPSYGGIAGEFHALRHGERRIGSTIFLVEPRLDAGPPLFQVELPTEPRETVFRHVLRNNAAAGALLFAAVRQFSRQQQLNPRLVDDLPAKSYFTWPQANQVRELRRRGVRLIGASDACHLVAEALRLRQCHPDLL